MTETTAALVEDLRRAGARCAFLHGSRVNETASDGSDVDVAAWWGSDRTPPAWEVRVPAGVDLLVLDDAPLWLAGRVAQHGRLIFDDDPPARVRWQAETRAMYLDQAALRQATVAEYLGAVTDGRR